MIDLLTVAFREELPILKVQAQSVERYGKYLESRNIYVIVNDDVEVCDLIDVNWWGELAPKVKILHRDIFSINKWHTGYSQSGWINQQLLKILGASISFNHWTYVLDAKTVLVNNAIKGELAFSPDMSRQKTLPIEGVWGDFQITLQDLFQIKLTRHIAPNGVPFLFHNNTVRDLISVVKKLIGGEQFHEWFLKIPRPSEFLLYAAYLEYRDGCIKDKSITDPTNNWTHVPEYHFINICHSQVDDYNNIMKTIFLINSKTIFF